jgi:drug/metabolite transporter (DMT)-like permease
MRTMCRSRWFLPLFALALGGVVFGAQAVGGNPGSGLISWGILAATGAVFLFGGRSETIRGLRGDGRDERFQRIDIHATAFAGIVIITAIIVAFIVELANGHDGNPYAWLGALGGVAYLAAIVVMRLRG